MEIGVMVEPQAGGTYAELCELAKWADGAGLASFARSDHYLNGGSSDPSTDALTSFGGLARETENIKLTVLVTPLTFRHPAVIAKTAATLDEMSGGRFELGVGTGWMESEHEKFGMELPDLRTRFSLLYETVAFIKTAFGQEEEATYRGRHHELQVDDVLPKPVNCPIIIGGGGPKKTPRLAVHDRPGDSGRALGAHESQRRGEWTRSRLHQAVDDQPNPRRSR